MAVANQSEMLCKHGTILFCFKVNTELRAIIARHNSVTSRLETDDAEDAVARARAQSAKRKEAADILKAENNALR